MRDIAHILNTNSIAYQRAAAAAVAEAAATAALGILLDK